MPHDANRLKAAIVLAMTSIALDLSDRLKRQATRRLNDALQRQILPDGGHIARSPQTLLELLVLLLPLRQTYINLDQSLPKALVPAIDRIYPAFNFFRHRDGNLALFNGTGAVLATTLSALNRYDETGGAGFKALPHTGFHRLQAHDTVLIADTGKPLSAQLSKSAHAGTGAFELSSGQNRFIVNAGMPRTQMKRQPAWLAPRRHIPPPLSMTVPRCGFPLPVSGTGCNRWRIACRGGARRRRYRRNASDQP